MQLPFLVVVLLFFAVSWKQSSGIILHDNRNMLSSSSSSLSSSRIIRIAEPVWRAAVLQHTEQIQCLLQPGMTSTDHSLNSGLKRQQRMKQNQQSSSSSSLWTALDPKHPVYNFLIEYYGLKGVKGPKRLGRWSPSPALLLGDSDRIHTLDELFLTNPTSITTNNDPSTNSRSRSRCGSILLEGATEQDVGATLHLRGAMPTSNGIIYSPSSFFQSTDHIKASTPYVWYRSILQQTLTAEPILHCHGLHEWAMQYWPAGAAPPPSQQYQENLPLRVSQDTINAAVERRGVSCTHVDALRYFAPAAGPLNHHGALLQRQDQLRLEQPACVHAHMDLLKMILRLQPFCDARLVQQVLQVALEARTLDVAASPYDASAYGVSVIPIETKEGRAHYRDEQTKLMHRVKPIREELLQAYDLFLETAFGSKTQEERPDPERFATAEPGGPSWRRSLQQDTNISLS